MFEREVLREDAFCEVIVLRRDGRERADVLGFIRDLEKPQQKKIVKEIDHIAKRGPRPNPEKWRELKGTEDICEIKIHGVRIMCFFTTCEVPRQLVLTQGFKKKGNSTPGTEIDRAERIRAEYFQQFGE